jgi:tetratricopeptide (TPR) repeat protein
MLLRIGTSVAVATAILLGSACNGNDTQNRQTLGAVGSDTADMQARAAESKLPLPAIAALDAGNAAYRAKNMEQAIAHYREATAIAPDHVAPWYGIFMAASEMKNSALADSAMARVRVLSPDPAMYDAHTEASTRVAPPPLPPGHPTSSPLPPGHPATTVPPPTP